MTVELTGDSLVEMDEGTHMWVQLIHFRLDPADDDHSVLRQLVAHDAYAHDYASPFTSDPPPPGPRIHGPWWLDALSADRFHLATPEHAVTVLDRWAHDQGWSDPTYRPPPEVTERLEPVHRLLRSGRVFELDNPVDESLHEWGFVVGRTGFHEFVVLDRGTASLHLVVASDD